MGSGNSNFKFIVFFVFMAVSSVSVPLVDGIIFDTITVFVQNDLENNQPLTVHCQSRDDDLGEHTLAHRQDIHWSFHIDIFQWTRFWCSMQWSNSTGQIVQGTYDIYFVRRDWRLCGDNCYWSIRESGWYLYHKDGEGLYFMYKWPSN
ncbi:hypothetical protein MKW98_012954 [Papaver atlanticum]|uniref:S-protein homolog n=1 Tax=Papaver atlanticum TaxID=357466 RepID=A0AAD4SKR4_9MAGN|nr:hypothetical protein MKW98_012954 [Papaver atlanticum]